ncbi:unnamed protein product [Clonostachys rhizophaga]|uniref:Zn(2)-C6 fungal-type domain-containing protein n=1 Tax=Clonostachys rhizophaga TaxID=160324 RepID=A0A9N9YIC6_9HYPO|nr:unnamed protein product [Clonostachys rhizophaga]
MGKAKNPDAKMGNQSWRKKPRKFAPKSRLGSQPSCMKCQSTGRTCDGYGDIGDVPSTFSAGVGHERHHIEHRTTRHYPTATSVSRPTRCDIQPDGLHLQNPRAFMILPVTGPTQAEALSFFEDVAIKNLNEYRPSNSWRKTLMFFSQTEPSVRCAAIALALMHRNHLDPDSGHAFYQPRSLKCRLQDEAPLLYYNRAIQLLVSQKNDDDNQVTAITLLVCYLFTCFDHMAGNYVQAIKHLRGGIELSRNIYQAILSKHDTLHDTKSSGVQGLIYEVTRQIRRLDMQAAMFLIDWTPVDREENYVPQVSISATTFQSIEQAADHLQILVTQVMRLRNTGQELSPLGKMPPLPPPFKGIILRQLESWSNLFESMLQQENPHETTSESLALISLLRLQYTMAWTLVKSHSPDKEMGFDNFLPQFRQCVALARDVAAAHERYSGSLRPTFTPEVGILPVLYIIGVKCRDPIVRREALDILRRQPIQEAVWDSISTARVLERVIEIEEGGSQEGDTIQSMEEIHAWERIEALSWILTTGQMDIKYTFCGREGLHLESLLL